MLDAAVNAVRCLRGRWTWQGTLQRMLIDTEDAGGSENAARDTVEDVGSYGAHWQLQKTLPVSAEYRQFQRTLLANTGHWTKCWTLNSEK